MDPAGSSPPSAPLRLSHWGTAAAVGLGAYSIGTGTWNLFHPTLGIGAALGQIAVGGLLILPSTRRWIAVLTSLFLLLYLAWYAPTLGTAFLLLTAILATLSAPRPGAASEAVALFLALIVAGLNFAGILRIQPTGPPESRTLAVSSTPSLRGFGRFFLYAVYMFADCCRRFWRNGSAPKA